MLSKDYGLLRMVFKTAKEMKEFIDSYVKNN